jgi:hypothetical protein
MSTVGCVRDFIYLTRFSEKLGSPLCGGDLDIMLAKFKSESFPLTMSIVYLLESPTLPLA